MAEISKRYERAQVATLAELAGGAEAQKPRGEYILVIAPPESTRSDGPGPAPSDIQRVYGEAVDRGLERREALKETARQLGLRRREVFDALTEKDDDEPVGA